MTSDQIGGLIRTILGFLGGYAVAQGWVDNETMLQIVGAVATLGVAVWSFWTNRASKVINTETGKAKSITP